MMEDKVLICNCCGKTLRSKNGVLKEDALVTTKEWGFFSQKDLEVHHICICEECYDQWISTFKVPVEKEQKREVL